MTGRWLRRARALAGALLCATAISACASTLQDQPIAHSILEGMIVAPYPVYWLGATFHGQAITEATKDPSGAFRVQYGDCVAGGQSTCVPIVRVVTSPDNSFIPGGESPARQTSVRGVPAVVTEAGKTIELATAGVVVSIRSTSVSLTGSAAQTIVAINAPSAPQAPLAAPLPDTGFDRTPLPTQMPSPLHPPVGPQLPR